MTSDIKPDWIALDCSTSPHTAWAIAGGAVLDKRQTPAAWAGLDPAALDASLVALAQGWDLTGRPVVVACGIQGAEPNGVPTPKVPCAPLALGPQPLTTMHFDMILTQGLLQTEPSDVMHGPEAAIAGFLALNPKWDGVICLVDAQTVWAQISAQEVVSFQSYMTGELFEILASQSSLRPSLEDQTFEAEAFDGALEEALRKPDKLAARLCTIRADGLLGAAPAASGWSRLMGLLVGAEIAAARPYWLGTQIAVLGEGDLARAYARALEAQGAPATLASTERMTLAGLTATFRDWKENA